MSMVNRHIRSGRGQDLPDSLPGCGQPVNQGKGLITQGPAEFRAGKGEGVEEYPLVRVAVRSGCILFIMKIYCLNGRKIS